MSPGQHLELAPQLEVDGLPTLSSRDLFVQGRLTMALLGIHMCYRAYRYPAQAVLIQESISLSELRSEFYRLGCKSEPSSSSASSAAAAPPISSSSSAAAAAKSVLKKASDSLADL